MTCSGWHRFGERCGCGYLGTSARFHWYEGEEKLKVPRSQEGAEAKYVEWARAEKPDLYERIRPVTKPVTSPVSVTSAAKTCDTCGEPVTGYGRECSACRKRRSRAQ